MGDITAGKADFLDIGQEPTAVVNRVMDTAIQVQDPVHVLFVAMYIRDLVT